MIRIYFVTAWRRPGDETPPDLVADNREELLALANAAVAPRPQARALEPFQREVLRLVAGRVSEPARPIDVIASGAVYQILPR